MQDSATLNTCESSSVLCVCKEDGILVCVTGSVESGIRGCDMILGKGGWAVCDCECVRCGYKSCSWGRVGREEGRRGFVYLGEDGGTLRLHVQGVWCDDACHKV